jgi:hypothetical protein
MNRFVCLLTIAFAFTITSAPAQVPPAIGPCGDVGTQICDTLLTLRSGEFSATPLMDGTMQDYGDPNHSIVSLYGAYGNDESHPVGPNSQLALNHYNMGTGLTASIMPLCPDGSTTNCTDSQKAIVFLIIGFSNCDQEICGGLAEAWGVQRQKHGYSQLTGQPCATNCPNLHNPDYAQPWNQITGDPILQLSFLNQVYPDQNNPNGWLVNPQIVVWDGALGGQNLSKWDPTPFGYYQSNDCFSRGPDAECNYKRVRSDLTYNGYTEKQVQAILVYTSDSFPNCDLKLKYCTTDSGNLPDA